MNSRATWAGFLVVAFAVVGLTGLFASFAAPLPLQRELAREQVLDEAQAAAHRPDAAQALEALRPRLDESASALLPPSGDMDAKIATERASMRARLGQESDAISLRLRWMICVVTLMGSVFGIAILKFSRA